MESGGFRYQEKQSIKRLVEQKKQDRKEKMLDLSY